MCTGRICLIVTFFIISLTGCATMQYVPKPTDPVVGADSVRIIVERSSDFAAGGCDVKVNDGDNLIGKVFPGNNVVWDRPPGTIKITATQKCPFQNPDIRTLQIRAKAGETYVVDYNHVNHLISLKSGNQDDLKQEMTNEVTGYNKKIISQNINSTPSKSINKEKMSLAIGKKWAVVIGISEYQHTGPNGLNNLIYADDDALSFEDNLKKLGWSSDHIKLLVNKNATQRKIMITLESWLTKAGPNDQIVLFWAGHGYPDPEDPEKVYFACYDTDIRIPATGYRMDKVRAALEERRSKNVIVLADTCHAGKIITRGDRGISIIPNIEKLRKEKKVPKGWIFMVGADTDRQAIENSSWSNGAFTHSLIKGLSGEADGFQNAGVKDGAVTMGELKDYMNTVMPDETQKVLGVAKRPVITTSTGDPDIWNLTLQVN